MIGGAPDFRGTISSSGDGAVTIKGDVAGGFGRNSGLIFSGGDVFGLGLPIEFVPDPTKKAVQPLPGDIAEAVRGYLADKPGASPVP